jgi:hypothetical protein
LHPSVDEKHHCVEKFVRLLATFATLANQSVESVESVEIDSAAIYIVNIASVIS